MRRLVALAAVLTLAGVVPAHAEVRLAIQNGRVTLTATNATLRQILEEWARVGQTKIVNVERVTGVPLTLELKDVPEAQALEIILRSLSGYVAAPRPVQNPSASRFDRIVVMATSTPVRAAPAGGQSSVAFAPPPPPQREEQEEPDDAADTQPANLVVPGPRPPVFVPSPTAQPPAPAPTPGMSTLPIFGSVPAPATGQPALGVSTPGMLVPAPPQPGSPGASTPGNQAPQD